MNFLIPYSNKTIPTEEQYRFLFALTHKTKFPGFLQRETLNLQKEKTDDYLIELMDDRYGLAESLKRPYLFIPYNAVGTYIVDRGFSFITGIIAGREKAVFWFEDQIETRELWSALNCGAPIIVRFVNLGNNPPCRLCDGVGAIDWIDDIQISRFFNFKVPRDPYILSTIESVSNFIIDNKWILGYDGDNIIYPCPICMGMGCDSVLRKFTGRNGTEELILDGLVNPDGKPLLRYVGARGEILSSQPCWNPELEMI